MPPNSVPIVATPSNWKIRLQHRRHAPAPPAAPAPAAGPAASTRTATAARLSTAMPAVAQCTCGMTCSSCHTFSWKCSPPVTGRPRKYRHWPTKMMTPMPAVKPVITGSGMKRMMPPMRVRPSASSMAPAMNVAICRPSMPCLAVTPARITTKAPVGPGDLQAAATEQRDESARDDGRVDALLGLRARSDREGHCERQRDDADDEPRDEVAQPVLALQQTGLPGLANRDHVLIRCGPSSSRE